jgi:hypothetical protein
LALFWVGVNTPIGENKPLNLAAIPQHTQAFTAQLLTLTISKKGWTRQVILACFDTISRAG